MVDLQAALDRRLSGTENVVPVRRPVDEVPDPANRLSEPRPATEIYEGVRVSSALRDVAPGEVGYDNLENDPPETLEYSPANLQAFLTRSIKGCQFMLSHLSSDDGYDNIGLLVNVLDKAKDMLIAHDVRHRLGGRAG